jgi:antirestriction protein
MKVELTNEAVDGLMRSILIQDYKGLCSDIKNLESAEKLASYQREDLEHNYEYKSAMEKLMEYYVGFDWKDQL